jgi:hypothetical protein
MAAGSGFLSFDMAVSDVRYMGWSPVFLPLSPGTRLHGACGVPVSFGGGSVPWWSVRSSLTYLVGPSVVACC